MSGQAGSTARSPGSAQRAYDGLTPAQQDAARQVFTRLTATTGDGVVTSARADRADLTEGRPGEQARDVDAVLEAFAAERLITLAAGTVEVSHEALLTAWPLLRAIPGSPTPARTALSGPGCRPPRRNRGSARTRRTYTGEAAGGHRRHRRPDRRRPAARAAEPGRKRLPRGQPPRGPPPDKPPPGRDRDAAGPGRRPGRRRRCRVPLQRADRPGA